MDVTAKCAEVRASMLELQPKLQQIKQMAGMIGTSPLEPGKPCPDVPEMIANVMLAYRHLEDARMRIGKVMQAYDGGHSCYPR